MGIFCCLPDPVDFDAEVTLFHFDLHRAVGKGAFGKVRVVEHKRTKKLYALKYIEKAKCIKQRAVANIIQERRLLEEVDHSFVVNLRYAFQDDENCFFVLDLMLGGDLRFHLDRKAPLSEAAVKFWVAELSSALAYLHRQRIIHRDIKPDNILLDSGGHAHITDFNVAIHYSSTRLHTSVAGSLAYMAPEVCSRKGYSWQVDWWSLGVTAYELLFRRRPFEGKTADTLTNAIERAHIRIPEKALELYSEECISAIRSLLDRAPHRRLGCRPDVASMSDVESHPWFSNIEFDLLETKELQSPFVPDMKKANFDISHELDEFLMVDKPLSATKRKANPNFDKMKPEFRQMEEQFTTFDFTRPRRISYYPHNQPLMVHSPKADVDSEGTAHSQTNTMVVGVTTMGERSLAGSPDPDPDAGHQYVGSTLLPTPPDPVIHRQRSVNSQQW